MHGAARLACCLSAVGGRKSRSGRTRHTRHRQRVVLGRVPEGGIAAERIARRSRRIGHDAVLEAVDIVTNLRCRARSRVRVQGCFVDARMIGKALGIVAELQRGVCRPHSDVGVLSLDLRSFLFRRDLRQIGGDVVPLHLNCSSIGGNIAEAVGIRQRQERCVLRRVIVQLEVELLDVAHLRDRRAALRLDVQRIARDLFAVIGKDIAVVARAPKLRVGKVGGEVSFIVTEVDDVHPRQARQDARIAANDIPWSRRIYTRDRAARDRDGVLGHIARRSCCTAAADDVRDCAALDAHFVLLRRGVRARHRAADDIRDRAAFDDDMVHTRRTVRLRGKAAVDVGDRAGSLASGFVRALDNDPVLLGIRRAVRLAAVNEIEVRRRDARHRDLVVVSRMTIPIRCAAHDFVCRRRVRAVIRPCIVPEDTVVHDNGSRCVRTRIRADEILGVPGAVVARGIVLEMQRVRRRALQQLDAAHAVDILEIVGIDRRAVDADLAPIDARAREISRVLDGQHHVVIRKRLIQLEIVALEVVDGLYGDILPVDAERIARDIRLVAAIDRARRERRTSEIGMLRVAKADRVARRLACANGIAAVNIGGSTGILEASARDGDAVVRDIARADSIAAVNRAFDLAACDGDAVVHDIPCAGSHARTAECTASVDSSRSDLTA